MHIQSNKRIVAQYLDHFGRSNIPSVLGMTTDDATWWVNSRTDLFRGAGTWSKEEIAGIWRDLYSALRRERALRPLILSQTTQNA